MNRRTAIKNAVAAGVALAVCPSRAAQPETSVEVFASRTLRSIEDMVGKVYRVEAKAKDPQSGSLHEVHVDYQQSARYTSSPNMWIWDFRVWVDGKCLPKRRLEDAQKYLGFTIITADACLLKKSQQFICLGFNPKHPRNESDILERLLEARDTDKASGVKVSVLFYGSDPDMEIDFWKDSSDESLQKFASEVATTLRARKLELT